MTPEAWATLASAAVILFLAVIGAVVWFVRLEGRMAEHKALTEGRIKVLEDKVKEHGDVRDLVIEMRAEMRGVQRSIEDLAKALKEITMQRRSARAQG